MSRSLCERVTAPLLELHRKTTPVAAVVMLGAIGGSVLSWGCLLGNPHVAWPGVVIMVVASYGFLLCGCVRLLAAKEAELHEYRSLARRNEWPRPRDDA